MNSKGSAKLICCSKADLLSNLTAQMPLFVFT
jgi:hypothetical protein